MLGAGSSAAALGNLKVVIAGHGAMGPVRFQVTMEEK